MTCVWLQLGWNTSGYKLEAMIALRRQYGASNVDYSPFAQNFTSKKVGFDRFQHLNWLVGVICDAWAHMQEFLAIKALDTVFSELRNNDYLYTVRYALVQMPLIFS